MLKDFLVHVGAAQLRIAAGGFDLEHPFAKFHDGDVQRAAAQIDHRDAQFLPQPVEPISQGCCGRFVDQTHHFKACDAAGVFGGGALIVIKIGRHSHDRFLHGFAQKRFGIAFYFLQQECRELLGRIIAFPQTYIFASAHLALESAGGAFRIRRCLAAGRLTHQHLPVHGDRNVAGKGFAADADTFGAGNDHGASAAQHGSGGIGCAKIDAYDVHESPIPVSIVRGRFAHPGYGCRVHKNRNIFHSENARHR